MTKFSGEFPYNEYWIYAPIYHKKENRNYAILVNKENPDIRTSVSYAKYLISVHLGRLLEPNETVDHKNEVRTDDRIENLQILTRLENQKKYINARVYKTVVDLKCPNCGKEFTKDIHGTHLNKHGVFTSCSRRCSGTLRQKLQVGTEIDFSYNVISVRKVKSKV